jgi:hypothetical protein
MVFPRCHKHFGIAKASGSLCRRSSARLWVVAGRRDARPSKSPIARLSIERRHSRYFWQIRYAAPFRQNRHSPVGRVLAAERVARRYAVGKPNAFGNLPRLLRARREFEAGLRPQPPGEKVRRPPQAPMPRVPTLPASRCGRPAAPEFTYTAPRWSRRGLPGKPRDPCRLRQRLVGPARGADGRGARTEQS